jgi:hypothetical protein
MPKKNRELIDDKARTDELVRQAELVLKIWGADVEGSFGKRKFSNSNGLSIEHKKVRNSLGEEVTSMTITYGRKTIYDSKSGMHYSDEGAEYALKQTYESTVREESRRGTTGENLESRT